jgi:hypothetical protein
MALVGRYLVDVLWDWSASPVDHRVVVLSIRHIVGFWEISPPLVTEERVGWRHSALVRWEPVFSKDGLETVRLREVSFTPAVDHAR